MIVPLGSVIEQVIDKNVEQYQKLLADVDDMMTKAMLSSASPTMLNGSFSQASSEAQLNVTIDKLKQYRAETAQEMARYMTLAAPSSMRVLKDDAFDWHPEPRRFRRRGTHW